MLRTSRLSLTLALLTSALVPMAAVAGGPQPLSHSWGGYHWARTANPFTVKLNSNLTSDWMGYFNTASSDWNSSSVMNTQNVPGDSSSTTRRRCSMTAGQVEVCNYTYGQRGWLGIASINLSGSHITQGSVKVNDSYVMNTAEKLHVMCQEIGHTFGLDHQSTSGASLNTCMDYYSNTSNSDTKSTHPNAHDYDELVTIYSHLDSSTTLTLRPTDSGNGADIPAMSIDLDGPGQWGTEVERSDDGRYSTYVLDFGSDRRIITYVTWAWDATDEDRAGVGRDDRNR